MRFVLAAFAQIMFVGAPVTNACAAVSEKTCLTYINVCGCFFNLEHFYVPGVDFTPFFPPQRIVLLSIFVLSKLPCVRVYQINKEDLEAKKHDKSR